MIRTWDAAFGESGTISVFDIGWWFANLLAQDHPQLTPSGQGAHSVYPLLSASKTRRRMLNALKKEFNLPRCADGSIAREHQQQLRSSPLLFAG